MDKILIRLVVLAGGGFLMLNALFCALLFLPAILFRMRKACGAGKNLVTQ
ncbi:hypothetical protein [Bacteroides ovatus]|jgi:hypothetical protein